MLKGCSACPPGAQGTDNGGGKLGGFGNAPFSSWLLELLSYFLIFIFLFCFVILFYFIFMCPSIPWRGNTDILLNTNVLHKQKKKN